MKEEREGEREKTQRDKRRYVVADVSRHEGNDTTV